MLSKYYNGNIKFDEPKLLDYVESVASTLNSTLITTKPLVKEKKDRGRV